MQWRAKWRDYDKWHEWFAWYPVYCPDIGKTVWWEHVERQLVRYYLDELPEDAGDYPKEQEFQLSMGLQTR